MTTIDLAAAREEILYFLRNQDILSIAQRNVTTASATGTFAGESELLIAVSNVKNVRSVTVAGSPLVYKDDYEVDIDFDDSGTIKCKITFVAAQTGAYTIPYDYGSGAIFPDFPRPDLTISSFPRIGVDFLDTPTDWGGFNAYRTKMQFTMIAYDPKTANVLTYVQAARDAIASNYKSFKYLKPIRIITAGPIIKMERDTGKDKIFQQNLDFESQFNYETNLE